MGVVGTALHFWFVTAPAAIWHALTPLSIARAAALVIAYAAYVVVTLGVAAMAVRVAAFFGKAVAKGFRRGISER